MNGDISIWKLIAAIVLLIATDKSIDAIFYTYLDGDITFWEGIALDIVVLIVAAFTWFVVIHIF